MAAYALRVAMLCSYYVALNYGYWAFFKTASAHEYYETNWITIPTDANAHGIAVLIVFILSLLAATARNRPSELFGVVLLLSPVMPMLVVYTDRQAYGGYVMVSALLYALVFLIIKLPASKTDADALADRGYIKFDKLSIIILGITSLFIVLDIAIGNLANLNFDFSRVYDFRRLAQAQRGELLGYFESNLTGFLLGLGTVVALHRKLWVQIGLYVAASVIIFGLTSNRSHFFIVFVSIAFYLVAMRKNPFAWIVLGATFTALASGLAFQISPNLRVLGDSTIGRVMFVPAIVNFLFYDYFSQNLFTYWSDTRITFGLVANPYGITGARVVFDHFYGKDLSNDVFFGNANTGFLGAGYGHAGFLGMAVYAVAVGFMVRASDALARKTNPSIAFGAFSYMFVMSLFTSTDVPTIVITYGFFIAICVILLLKKTDIQRTAKT
jgi:hypothetical protein